MILVLRRYLYATNIFVFVMIYIIQKCLQIFCIIEQKTCGNVNCTPEKLCDDNCSMTVTSISVNQDQEAHQIALMPKSFRKAIKSVGYSEGYFQIFLEKAERDHFSKAHLNAATAEVKLNPN